MTAVNVINQAAFLLPIATMVFGLGAVLLARNKRRTMMAIAWVVVVLMLLLAEVVNLAQYSVMGALSGVDAAATSAGYSIVTGGLLSISQTILVMAILLVLAGFITGPSRPAAYAQAKLGKLTTSHGSARFYGAVGANAGYVVGGISVLAILLVIFPLSRAPAYMITVVTVAIVLAFVTIAIRQGTTNDKNS